jgi:hypothetical protein
MLDADTAVAAAIGDDGAATSKIIKRGTSLNGSKYPTVPSMTIPIKNK